MKTAFLSSNHIHVSQKFKQLFVYKGILIPFRRKVDNTCDLVDDYYTSDSVDVIVYPLGMDLLLIERSDKRVSSMRFLNETGEFLTSHCVNDGSWTLSGKDALSCFLYDSRLSKLSYECVAFPGRVGRFSSYIITSHCSIKEVNS